jgi:predicted methyltransferase
MNRKVAGLLLAALVLAGCATPEKTRGPSLARIINGPDRSESFRMRDRYRHPRETLEFFGVKPNLTVVEVWPAPGWYAEILAPYLRDTGRYIVAGFVTTWDGVPQWRIDAMSSLQQKFAARPDLYDRVQIVEIGKPDRWNPLPVESVDVVLTFRNVHNWMAGEYEREMFAAFFRMLKPGGTLGVVEHRALPGTDVEIMKKSGYVTEDYVIAIAQEAGFQFAAKSEANANPKDTKDYPGGVWTLPPSLKLGDENRAKYLEIGESDRMTLRFTKPLPAAPAPVGEVPAPAAQ